MSVDGSRLAGPLLVAATVLLLLPFVGKAFHIDDPLFIWQAQQVQLHPLNPYGFAVNWYLTAQPMYEIMKNPPAASYIIAAVATLVGWSEPALHAFFLLPAVGVILGTWRLGRELCGRPALAAAIALTSPVFLISATSVMCDTIMLCVWIWAVVLWVVGLRQGSQWRLGGAAVLIGFAALTKYFAAVLIPLLVVYTWIDRRRPSITLAWMLVPAGILALYQGWSSALYGRGLLSDAGAYAIDIRPPSIVMGGVTALVFVGGCLLPAAIQSFVLVRRWWLPLGAAALAIVAVAPMTIPTGLFDAAGQPYWGRLLEALLFAAGGASLLTIAAEDVLRDRSAAAWLLALWVIGTIVFAGFLNWTVNGRTILPMLPAAGILVARKLDHGAAGAAPKRRFVAPWIGVVFAGIVGLVLARADFVEANAAREAARRIVAEASPAHGTLWFTGHWGFQFYMEAGGGRPIDVDHSTVLAGDVYALPMDNTNRVDPPPEYLGALTKVEIPLVSGVTVFRVERGPGFYAGLKSVLPFVFESFQPDTYLAYGVTGWFGQAPPGGG